MYTLGFTSKHKFIYSNGKNRPWQPNKHRKQKEKEKENIKITEKDMKSK